MELSLRPIVKEWGGYPGPAVQSAMIQCYKSQTHPTHLFNFAFNLTKGGSVDHRPSLSESGF